MRNPTPVTVYLKDYRPPEYLITRVELDFDLRDGTTTVTATLALARNSDTLSNALTLHGDGLMLRHIELDGRALSTHEYLVTPDGLTLHQVPAQCTLRTIVELQPATNTQLMGLYASHDGYFTQCEAEGFRRITYFLDRPDVMARYTTTIRADRARFPVLLSNGNLIASGIDGARHWARFEDPFPKPSYLFAMVAAKLDVLEDHFVTRSGRTVKLFVYVEPGRVEQCHFAMAALQSSMRWDEETFGLELDLDQYMIVAVSDFNMGAMENKGLNLFNTKYVLARPELATDSDFMMLDRVVAHEYFHNWTGNRVTCRDWFQLSLKEGLTVFRDQQYGGDRYSHAVQRIQEVRGLRNQQFPEDAGPMAHPVRPAAYMEISNFYTATIYNKGAEVVRMLHTLLGPANFRRGMDLYFKRHDGQAVCTEDFVSALQDASGIDLTLMQRWYDQAGTPHVNVSGSYDSAAQTFTLTFTQSCRLCPGETHKAPFPIPLRFALFDENGQALPLDGAGATEYERVHLLTDEHQALTLHGIARRPIPSLLRGFSAPVVLDYDYAESELATLMAFDTDLFNRWEAGQRLATQVLLRAVTDIQAGAVPEFSPALIAAFARTLDDAPRDPAFAAEALNLPAETYLAEMMEIVDPDAIQRARIQLRRSLAIALRESLLMAYQRYRPAGPYTPSPEAAGQRALRNACLGYLMELEEPSIRALCVSQLAEADNMTDASAALSLLANFDCPERQPALAEFYTKWQAEPLVIDKWFTLQATSRLPLVQREVAALRLHPAFDLSNPNRVRALIGAFCQGNHAAFHAADGGGYRFAAAQIIALDPKNPQIAARLARAFDRWRKFDPARQALARAALESIQRTVNLSTDTTEVINRALQ